MVLLERAAATTTMRKLGVVTTRIQDSSLLLQEGLRDQVRRQLRCSGSSTIMHSQGMTLLMN